MTENQTDKVKKFAYTLSKKVREYLDATPNSQLPLRPSQIKNHHEIKKMVKSYGFRSIYDGLRSIVLHKLYDFIPEMSVEEKEKYGRTRYDWYFNKVSSARSKKDPNEPPLVDVRLNVETDPTLFFSEKELTLLEKHKDKFENLINGKLQPKTILQEKFKTIAIELISGVGEKTEPKEYYEKLIVKQLIYQRIISKRS